MIRALALLALLYLLAWAWTSTIAAWALGVSRYWVLGLATLVWADATYRFLNRRRA